MLCDVATTFPLCQEAVKEQQAKPELWQDREALGLGLLGSGGIPSLVMDEAALPQIGAVCNLGLRSRKQSWPGGPLHKCKLFASYASTEPVCPSQSHMS